jgi:hypothetical protein
LFEALAAQAEAFAREYGETKPEVMSVHRPDPFRFMVRKRDLLESILYPENRVNATSGTLPA